MAIRRGGINEIRINTKARAFHNHVMEVRLQIDDDEIFLDVYPYDFKNLLEAFEASKEILSAEGEAIIGEKHGGTTADNGGNATKEEEK